MTPQEEQDMRVLEHIYEHDQGVLREPAGLAEIWELVGEEPGRLSAMNLIDQALIERDGRLSGGFHITARGREQVEAMQARRNDRGRRRRECREDFLRWVDSRTEANPSTRVAREDFDGSADLLPYSDAESAAAADHLESNGLINSVSVNEGPHIQVWMTELGRECIDSGQPVRDFLRSDAPSGGQTILVTGSNNTIAAAHGDDNQVEATVVNFNHDKAVEFAAAVRQALTLGALPDVPESVHELLADIEQRDDPTRAQRATAGVRQMLMAGGGSAIGQGIIALGDLALGLI